MTYSKSTIRRAEQILGYGISDSAGNRAYSVIDGIIYADLFTGTPTINEYSGTFTTRFNGKTNDVDYYNEIVLNDKCESAVTVDASWGSDEFMSEIDGLLNWLESNTFENLIDDASINSKKIEDFSVTMKNSDEAKNSIYDAIRSVWYYYIRNIMIISVTHEQRDDWRRF